MKNLGLFCAPLNKVQAVATSNRSGNSEDYSIEKLEDLYREGYRINLDVMNGFKPSACHQEIKLDFKKTCNKLDIVIAPSDLTIIRQKELLAGAEEAFSKGDINNSIRLIESALSLDPNNLEINIAYGKYIIKKWRFTRSRKGIFASNGVISGVFPWLGQLIDCIFISETHYEMHHSSFCEHRIYLRVIQLY